MASFQVTDEFPRDIFPFLDFYQISHFNYHFTFTLMKINARIYMSLKDIYIERMVFLETF